MNIIFQKTEAGNIGAVSIYERGKKKSSRYRCKKKNATTDAQQIKNDRKRLECQILLIDKNFSRHNSTFYTLTFRRKDNDPSVYEALKHFQNFIKCLKRHCPNIRYSAVLHQGSLRGRPHFHLLVNCTDRSIIANLWKHGWIYKSKIKTNSFIGIVKYMYYGAYRMKNRSLFMNSRNLVKPYTFTREIEMPFERFLDIIDEIGDYCSLRYK